MSLDIADLRRLRAFECAARLESVNRAAAEIGLSQPAVTQAVAKLEARLGIELLQRRRDGSYPTRHGEIVYRRTQRFLAQIAAALTEIAADPGGVAHKVSGTQLRCLVEIAAAGTFGAAARALDVSQASLHRAARDLERLARRPLFRRTVAGVSVNRAGGELARRIRLAIRELEYAEDELRAVHGDAGGHIAVGILPLAPARLLAAATDQFLRAHPRTRIEIADGSYEALHARLRAGTIDFILGALRRPPPEADIAEELLFADPYSIVVRREHPLTRARILREAELGRYDWIVPSQDTPRRATIERLFARLEYPPATRIETSSLATMLALLAESNRVTLLSRSQILLDGRLDFLTALPIPVPESDRAVGITTRADWLPTQVHVDFLGMFRDECRALAPLAPPLSGSI